MKEELIYYGLSDKEADIYLSCLKLGESTANDLSVSTGVRRSTTYEILESLKKKGFISSFAKDKKTYFKSAPPDSFLNELEIKKSLIASVLDDLRKLEGKGAKGIKVSLYEGKMGIKSVASEMLDYNEILVYGAGSRGDEVLGWYNENFARKRAGKKIFLKAILDEKVPSYMVKRPVSGFTKVKHLNFKTNKETAYFIFGDFVLVVLLGEEIAGVKISSKLFADSQREIFSLLWGMAK